MSGRELFSMWVRAALCSDDLYAWDMLSSEIRRRWDQLAVQLQKV